MHVSFHPIKEFQDSWTVSLIPAYDRKLYLLETIRWYDNFLSSIQSLVLFIHAEEDREYHRFLMQRIGLWPGIWQPSTFLYQTGMEVSGAEVECYQFLSFLSDRN